MIEMDEDYYSYISRSFRRWAPFYNLIATPLLRIRNEVVDLADAKKGSIYPRSQRFCLWIRHHFSL